MIGDRVDASSAVLTQMRVPTEATADFEAWLGRSIAVVSRFPGFVDVDLVPRTPPLKEDWVVVHRFAGPEEARSWLRSPERESLMDELIPLVVGDLDVAVFRGTTPTHSAASAVITTRVDRDREEDFLRWHDRVASAQADFEGFGGYRIERPVPGVQDDWVAILRFDSREHLDAWLASDLRSRMIAASEEFGQQARVRIVGGAFDSWFAPAAASERPAAPWKQNMLVLLALYPLVFLFGEWVQDPLLLDEGVPFWLALFVGNAVSVAMLGWLLIPAVSRAFAWWLRPASGDQKKTTLAGVGAVVGLYAVFLGLFAVAF